MVGLLLSKYLYIDEAAVVSQMGQTMSSAWFAKGLKNNCAAQSLVPSTVCHRSAHNEAENVLAEIHQDHCFLTKEKNCKMVKVSVYNVHVIIVEWRVVIC